MGAVLGTAPMRGRPGRRRLSCGAGGLILGTLFPFPAPERLRRFEEREEAGETGVSTTGLDCEVVVELALEGRLGEFLGLAEWFGGLDGEVIVKVGFAGSAGLSDLSDVREVGAPLLEVELSPRAFLLFLPPLRMRLGRPLADLPGPPKADPGSGDLDHPSEAVSDDEGLLVTVEGVAM